MKNVSEIVNHFDKIHHIKIIKNIILIDGIKNGIMQNKRIEYKFEKVAKEVYKRISWVMK
jgi:hypothetical protein